MYMTITNAFLVSALDITLPDALLMSGVGILVVLSALGLLALFIVGMSKVVARFTPKNTAVPVAAPVAAPVTNNVSAAAPVASDPNKVALPTHESQGNLLLNGVSEYDAALVMAVVAQQLNAPLNTLVFKSIKEV